MKYMYPRDPLKPLTALPVIPKNIKVVSKKDFLVWCNAQQIVEAARRHADAIKENAKLEFESERKRGYAEGELQAQIGQSERIIETISLTVEYLSKFEHEIVELVMEAVRRIIDGFDDQEKVMIVARNALSVVRNQKQITLRLNPSQIESVRSSINDLLLAFPYVGFIDLLADSRVSAGTCILESPVGLIEASLEGQLTALRSSFERILGSRV